MSFAAPLFLLGLAALLVPWLLHRLNQHDAPEHDFPSSLFLEPTTAISSRKKNLRYLKLLALRLLFLTLLCLLFAEPAFKRLNELLGEDDILHLIVVDKSYSMRESGNWSDAKETVADIVKDLKTGSSMQLMSAGAKLQIDTDITANSDSLLKAMSSMAPGFERLEYGELMRELSAYSAEQELAVHVHLVSDMQSSAVPARAGELINREFASLDLYQVKYLRENRRLSESDAINAEPVSADTDNAAIRATVKPRDENTFDLIAEISHFRKDAATFESKVTLYKSGEFISDQVESLAWPSLGEIERYQLEISPADELVADDRIEIAVQQEPQIPIAIVSNSTQRQRRNSVDELYLQTALQFCQKKSRLSSTSTI